MRVYTGTNLSGVDLSDIDMSKANLSRANLENANLDNTNLYGIITYHTNFNNAILTCVGNYVCHAPDT